jgi:hypothetical protein
MARFEYTFAQDNEIGRRNHHEAPPRNLNTTSKGALKPFNSTTKGRFIKDDEKTRRKERYKQKITYGLCTAGSKPQGGAQYV